MVPRAKLAEALVTIAECVSDGDGDADAEWRAALSSRYGTVRGFIRLLVDTVDFGAVQAPGGSSSASGTNCGRTVARAWRTSSVHSIWP